ADIHAVSILEMQNKGEEFKLKFDVFEGIFDQVRNTPLAIISIAGPFRKGKSFMLNLLLHYLMEGQSSDVYKDKKAQIRNIFNWRGGVERTTVGIEITNKPIMVKDKSGKRVAVFFMDTQGMFDHKTTGKGCSAIFAMSTLLSSMQIYNLSGHIQEDHLQYLEIFTNYARYAVEQKQHANASTCPFQGLMFLLRNWEMADYQFGQEGRMQLIREKIEIVSSFYKNQLEKVSVILK
uniref:GB1/RHD3-type G domain-containing protein n=1 Tax=Ciona intestinalis TaxID=7719 RepID=H2XKL8_CIOIN